MGIHWNTKLAEQRGWTDFYPQFPAHSSWKFADYYHVAPTVDRARIDQHGLQPSSPKNNPNWTIPPERQTPTGVYGFPDYGDDDEAWQYKQFLDQHRGEGHDIWHVRGEDWNADPDIEDAAYTNKPVQPQMYSPHEEAAWPEQPASTWPLDPFKHQDIVRDFGDQMDTYNDQMKKGNPWGIGQPTAKTADAGTTFNPVAPIDELTNYLGLQGGSAAGQLNPNNPLGTGADPMANKANPNMNPNMPGAFNNPSNPELNAALPGAATNPSNPQFNPSMPNAQNNPSNYAWNPQMPSAQNNPSSPSLNPNYPGSFTNPSNPMHNPDYPNPEALNVKPEGLSPDASFPPGLVSTGRKYAWTPSVDGVGDIPDVGDAVGGSTVWEMDNLTTHLEDGRALPLEEAQALRESRTAADPWGRGRWPAILPDENGYYYHEAPTVERDRIQAHGLIPGRPHLNERWDNAANKVHMKQRNDTGVYVTNRPGGAARIFDEPMDTWRIPSSQVQDIRTDTAYNHAGGRIMHPVQPEMHESFEMKPAQDQHFQPWHHEGPPDPSLGVPDVENPGPEYDSDIHEYMQNQYTRGNPWGIGYPDRVIGHVREWTPRRTAMVHEARLGYTPVTAASSWHLTDDPNFALDPNRVPTDNTFALEQRTSPGLYVGDPEKWFNGSNYVRPYAAEIEHPDEAAQAQRWQGENFIPGEQLGQAQVKRVIPTDEWVREKYGEPGWIEDHHDYAMKGIPYSDQPKYPNYQYQGPDVRDMTPEQHQWHADRAQQFIEQSRPELLTRYDERGDKVPFGDPRWEGLGDREASWHFGEVDFNQGDSKQHADPTEPRPSGIPDPRGCTCDDGHKLDCPIHGMHPSVEDPDDMSWHVPENNPTGFPGTQPRGWATPYQS